MPHVLWLLWNKYHLPKSQYSHQSTVRVCILHHMQTYTHTTPPTRPYLMTLTPSRVCLLIGVLVSCLVSRASTSRFSYSYSQDVKRSSIVGYNMTKWLHRKSTDFHVGTSGTSFLLMPTTNSADSSTSCSLEHVEGSSSTQEEVETMAEREDVADIFKSDTDQ